MEGKIKKISLIFLVFILALCSAVLYSFYKNTPTFVSAECQHDWSNKDGICLVCGEECEAHLYRYGIFSGDPSWGVEIGYDSKNGTCVICGYECSHYDADNNLPTSINGVCQICGYHCEEHDWSKKDGTCSICHIDCGCKNIYYYREDGADAYWQNGTGVCLVCGRSCEHDFSDGQTCKLCGLICNEHDWSNKDGVCAKCKFECKHRNIDQNGICEICGYDTNVKVNIEYANLAFEDTIYLMFAVSTKNTSETPKMYLWEKANEYPFNILEDTTELELWKNEYNIEGEKYYVFIYRGLSAKQMTDNVYVKATVDGVESSVLKYSIIEYATDRLLESKDENFKNALTAMLDYGAAIQKYKGNYNANRLANDTYYRIDLEDCKFYDGTNYGYFTSKEVLQLDYFNETQDKVFDHIECSDGRKFANGIAIPVIASEIIKAVYVNKQAPKTVKALYNEGKDGTTLTFVYDIYSHETDGVTKVYYNLPTNANVVTSWGWNFDNNYKNIDRVIFDESFKDYDGFTSINYMLYGFLKLSEIRGLSYLNTSNVTEMISTFGACVSLTLLDLSGFDTSKVTSMLAMFLGCTKINTLGLSSFDFSNVEDVSSIFSGCYDLTTIYVSSDFKLKDGCNTTDMFNGCEKLVGGLGTEYNDNYKEGSRAIIDGGELLPGYLSEKLSAKAVYKNVDGVNTLTFVYDDKDYSGDGVSVFLVQSVKPTNGWGWTNLNDEVEKVVFEESFKDFNRLIKPEQFFQNFTNLTEIVGLENLNTENIERVNNFFYGCSSLSNIDLSEFYTDNVEDFSGMFYGCSSLKALNVSTFNTEIAYATASMFYGCENLTTIYADDGFILNEYCNSSDMFMGCVLLKGGNGTIYNIDHIGGDYAKIDGNILTPGYFTSGKTPKIIYTEEDEKILTFVYDSKIYKNATVYNLPNVNVAFSMPSDWGYYNDGNYLKVTKVVFDKSFIGFNKLGSTSCMFYGCKNLTEVVGLNNLNTNNATLMDKMFYGCTSIESLSFCCNTSNVINLSGMFYNCTNLKYLDLFTFDTTNVNKIVEMFDGCSSLKTILVGDGFKVNESIINDSMFRACTSIEGGFGTTYDDGCRSAVYARADKEGEKGYFTLKQDKTLKAVYSETDDNNILTFYYDSKIYAGKVFYLIDNASTKEDWGYYCDGVYGDVTKVVFDESVKNYTSLTSTAYMFYRMYSLKEIVGISNLNTENVTIMKSMFEWCLKLTELDLTAFNTKNVTDTSFMFNLCVNLRTIYASKDFKLSDTCNCKEMFSNCVFLSGGNGTHYYNAEVYDFREYARIDGLDGKVGFFTAKEN